MIVLKETKLAQDNYRIWDIYLDGKLIEIKYKKRPLILNLENGVYFLNEGDEPYSMVLACADL